MKLAGESAKKAFEKAIDNVKANAKKLEEFVGQDIQINTKKEFAEFAEQVGDYNAAKSFCVIKYGKKILEVIK